MFTPPERQEVVKVIPDLGIDWPVAYQLKQEGEILERGFSFIELDETVPPQLIKNESNANPWAFCIKRRIIEHRFIAYKIAAFEEAVSKEENEETVPSSPTPEEVNEFLGWAQFRASYDWETLYDDSVQKVWRVTMPIVHVANNELIAPGLIEKMDALGETISSTVIDTFRCAFSTEETWLCSVNQQGVFKVLLGNTVDTLEEVNTRPIFLTKNFVVVQSEPSRQKKRITLTFRGGKLFEQMKLRGEEDQIGWSLRDPSTPLAARLYPPNEVLTQQQINSLPKEIEFERHSSTSSQIPPAPVQIDPKRLVNSASTARPNYEPQITEFKVAALSWTIRHTQQRYPTPLLLDSEKTVITADKIESIKYPNRSTIVVTFHELQRGLASL